MNEKVEELEAKLSNLSARLDDVVQSLNGQIADCVSGRRSHDARLSELERHHDAMPQVLEQMNRHVSPVPEVGGAPPPPPPVVLPFPDPGTPVDELPIVARIGADGEVVMEPVCPDCGHGRAEGCGCPPSDPEELLYALWKASRRLLRAVDEDVDRTTSDDVLEALGGLRKVLEGGMSSAKRAFEDDALKVRTAEDFQRLEDKNERLRAYVVELQEAISRMWQQEITEVSEERHKVFMDGMALKDRGPMAAEGGDDG
jgi:hypothetical protein